MSVFAEHETAAEREQPQVAAPPAPTAVEPTHASAVADEVVHRLAPPTTIRRFTLDHPDFSTATSARVFGSGGSGNVAEFDDGVRPLIVKVDQLIGNEVVVANNLHAQMGSASGGYQVLAPGTRLATPQERAAIKSAGTRLIDPTNARNFLANLDSDLPTVLMEKSSGVEVEGLLQGNQLVPGKKKGTTALDPSSLLHKIVHDAGLLTTLAHAVPADIVMGMYDRLLGSFNAQNFMLDVATNTFGFVDNTQNGLAGFLTTITTAQSVDSPEAAFKSWAKDYRHPENLATDPAAVATSMLRTLFGDPGDLKFGGGMGYLVDAQTLPVFVAEVDQNREKMLARATAAIQAGKVRVLDVLEKAERLVGGLPPERQLEALTSLAARRLFLRGIAVDAAWTGAQKMAAKQMEKLTVPSPTPSSSSSSSSSAPSPTWTPVRTPSPRASNTNVMTPTSSSTGPSSSIPHLSGRQRAQGGPPPTLASNTNAQTPTPAPTPTPSSSGSSSTGGSSGWKVTIPDMSKEPNFKK